MKIVISHGSGGIGSQNLLKNFWKQDGHLN